LGLAVLQWIREGNHLGLSNGEGAVEKSLELGIRGIIGPHGEDAPGFEERLQVIEPLL
tara:strand:- start:28 stop:201 length:174 start_codon:yes stop_codon:yes gene_type:complete